MGQNVFLLILTACIKFILTAWTFGIMVRAARTIFRTASFIGADASWYILTHDSRWCLSRQSSWDINVSLLNARMPHFDYVTVKVYTVRFPKPGYSRAVLRTLLSNVFRRDSTPSLVHLLWLVV